jgi:hypothetical protein
VDVDVDVDVDREQLGVPLRASVPAPPSSHGGTIYALLADQPRVWGTDTEIR